MGLEWVGGWVGGWVGRRTEELGFGSGNGSFFSHNPDLDINRTSLQLSRARHLEEVGGWVGGWVIGW